MGSKIGVTHHGRRRKEKREKNRREVLFAGWNDAMKESKWGSSWLVRGLLKGYGVSLLHFSRVCDTK